MSRRAFTLVELLIVIGIVALLIGILLPAMSRARGQARGAACVSNLRQLALAAQHYALNHGGRFPVARWGTDNWDFSIVNGKPAPGLLWRGHSDLRVQQCPAFEGRANSLDPHTGYNYNTSYIGHGQGEAVEAPARLAQVHDPSRTALFGDGEWANGANKFMRAPFPHPGDVTTTTRAAGTQGFRHSGGATNVAFVDGHVETLRERHVKTIPSEMSKVAPRTGFLSEDNSMYDLE
jgi:prepilin-type processing-associated H-X9-DG protein/prepilin-type N-terminal cleavage/methylation domain-containing protein